MSFPIEHLGHSFPDAPSLAEAVEADAAAGGGTVYAGLGPHEWVVALVEGAALEREIGVALAGHLLAAGRAPAVCTGARLALALGHPELHRMLSLALAGHDLGLLLVPDPLDPEHTVEDTLLRAWVGLAEHDEDRSPLLAHLRQAGLTALELEVLCRHGTEVELRAWLPAVIRDGLPEDLSLLAGVVSRGQAPAAAVVAAVDEQTLAALVALDPAWTALGD